MEASETLDDAVANVARDAQEPGGLYERRVFASSTHELYVTLAKPSTLPGIALVVGRSAILRPLDVETRGFRVRVQAVPATGKVRIAVEQVSTAFSELFHFLRRDIVTTVLKAGSDLEAVNAMRARLAHWQRFAQHAPDGLSVSEQIGLYGELVLLDDLMSHGVDPHIALEGWQGPDGAAHDFRTGTLAIEVKSTTDITGTKVSIANERQLDNSGLSRLILMVVSFDRRSSAGRTLPQFVEYLIARMPTAEFDLFSDRLLAAGYLHAASAPYGTHGFQSRGTRFFEVREGFPRVVPGSLLPGISNVSYLLDTVGLASFLVDREPVLRGFGRACEP
jgi:hypothetical protein